MDANDDGLTDMSEYDDPSAHCPVCRQSTFIGQTIMCETCQRWFHFPCVGVKETDDVVTKEDVPFFCQKCPGLQRHPAHKKVKKAKKKRSQRSKSNPKPDLPSPLKLKINLSGPKRSPSVVSRNPKMSSSSSGLGMESSDVSKTSRKRRKSRDEEEQWLDAVESGDISKVADDPELRSIKDPKLMTARQRAMMDKMSVTMEDDEIDCDTDDGHMSLDYGYKKKEEEDEHSLRMKALKSQKRKEMEMEKREQDKKKTMDRLLKKKEKSIKVAKTPKIEIGEYPKYTYKISVDRYSISIPTNYDFPLKAKPPVRPPKNIYCGAKNCSNLKKYNCSVSGVPLCSLKCYKTNLLTYSK